MAAAGRRQYGPCGVGDLPGAAPGWAVGSSSCIRVIPGWRGSYLHHCAWCMWVLLLRCNCSLSPVESLCLQVGALLEVAELIVVYSLVVWVLEMIQCWGMEISTVGHTVRVAFGKARVLEHLLRCS